MTQQRQLVYEIIRAAENHPTAAEVFAEAKRLRPSIVKATVYNNLNALTDTGLIRRVKVAGGPDHYDRLLAPHEHLVCEKCGRLSDLALGDLLPQLQQKTGLRLKSYELSIYYICDACRKRAQ